jgi:hypothetical protein
MFDNCFLRAVQFDLHNIRANEAGKLDLMTLKEQDMHYVG